MIELGKRNKLDLTSFSFGVVISACILVPLLVLFLSPKEEQPKVEQPIAKPVDIDAQLTALGRSLRIDEACFDKAISGFFVHFKSLTTAQMEERGLEEDELGDTWHFELTDNLDFLTLENNTQMVQNAGMKFADEVWPDVTGLTCKKFKADK